MNDKDWRNRLKREAAIEVSLTSTGTSLNLYHLTTVDWTSDLSITGSQYG